MNTKKENQQHTAGATIGTRIVLAKVVERFPHFLAEKGLRGTVNEITDDLISVRMDEEIGGAGEWDNCIVWEGDDVLSQFRSDVHFLAPRFVRVKCSRDGSWLSQFGEQDRGDQFSTFEAAALEVQDNDTRLDFYRRFSGDDAPYILVEATKFDRHGDVVDSHGKLLMIEPKGTQEFPRRIVVGRVDGELVDENGFYVGDATKLEIVHRYNRYEALVRENDSYRAAYVAVRSVDMALKRKLDKVRIAAIELADHIASTQTAG